MLDVEKVESLSKEIASILQDELRLNDSDRQKEDGEENYEFQAIQLESEVIALLLEEDYKNAEKIEAKLGAVKYMMSLEKRINYSKLGMDVQNVELLQDKISEFKTWSGHAISEPTMSHLSNPPNKSFAELDNQKEEVPKYEPQQ